MAPAPQVIPYMHPDGTEHAHIPDFYISSLNLIVNIKSSENKHYRLRDIDVEKAEDRAIEKTNFNYIKIYDNQFGKFIDGIAKIKEHLDDDEDKRPKIIIEEFTENADNTSELLD